MGSTGLWIIGGLVAVLLGGFILIWVISGGPVSYIDQAARDQFRSDLGHTSITIYPTLVREGYEESFDLKSAREIASFLNEQGFATATVAEEEPAVQTIGHRNELRVAAASALSLAQFVEGKPLETPYALMAEYFISPKDGRVMAVHYYLVTKAGRVADAGVINSHYRIFQEIDPRTLEDCTQVAIRHMEDSWAGSPEANTED
jgi:hypothetical protein